MPLPAALPTPGPPAPGTGTLGMPSSAGGGPSTVSETTCSPRRRTRPRLRLSSRSGPFTDLALSLRNSSQSARTRFMCLSNALNVPIRVRVSCENNVRVSDNRDFGGGQSMKLTPRITRIL